MHTNDIGVCLRVHDDGHKQNDKQRDIREILPDLQVNKSSPKPTNKRTSFVDNIKRSLQLILVVWVEAQTHL